MMKIIEGKLMKLLIKEKKPLLLIYKNGEKEVNFDFSIKSYISSDISSLGAPKGADIMLFF